VKYSSKKLVGYLVATLMLFGILVTASNTAQAQWGYGRDRDYRRDDRYGNYQSLQIARQQGYMYGVNTGAADAQRGQSFSPQRSRYFRNGNQGYRSAYGNRGQYQQVYRNAFVQGYREGYQRYAGYNRRGNNGRWGNGRWPR
jgi:hypothetical protein